MNRRIIIVLASILAAFPARTQTCAVPPAGLVSWWPGDGNADDIYGSNNGTAVGNVFYVVFDFR